MNLYINGEKIKSKKGNRILNIIREKNFIAHSNWPENDPNFYGLIDDLRIYNRALSDKEIKALYLKGKNLQDNIKEENVLTVINASFIDLTKNGKIYYAIEDKDIYTSVDGKRYIKTASAPTTLNAISSNKYNMVIAVGNGGRVLSQKGTLVNNIKLGDNNLLDIATNGNDFVVVGKKGSIYKLNLHQLSNSQKSNLDITSDIVSITYESKHKKYYAVTDKGEFLSSSDGLNWSKKSIDSKVSFTSLEADGDDIILVGKNGVVYYSNDTGATFKKASSSTTDDIIDVWKVADKYVFATQDELYISMDKSNWFKDINEFKKNSINGIYGDYKTLYVLATNGVFKLKKFVNIDTGTTKKATLMGVDVEFENSTISFKKGKIDKFDIKPNDTMWILHDDKKIAKLVLGNDTTFEEFSENNTTLDQFLFDKEKKYIEISGENKLYYNIGDDKYIPISQGEFWLRDSKVYEKPIFTQLSDKTKEEMDNYVDDYIVKYSEYYNSLNKEAQEKLLKPENERLALEGLVKVIEFGAKRLEEYYVTKNRLLFNNPKSMFMPKNITLPFFRELYLDSDKEKIEIKHSYFILPKFSFDNFKKIVSLKTLKSKLPTVEFTIDKDSVIGNVNDFGIGIGVFDIASKKAKVTLSLKDANQTEDILIQDAGFFLKTAVCKTSDSYCSMQKGAIGSKAVELKLEYNPNNSPKLQLKSGEFGGEISIPELHLGPVWTMKDMNTYLNIKIRELEDGDTKQKYKDKYDDDLGDLLVLAGTKATFEKSNAMDRYSKSYLSFNGKLDLMFGDNDARDIGFHNVYYAELGVSNFPSFPKAGVLTFTGLHGAYQYNKYGGSFWKLGGEFDIYKIPNKNYAMFVGTLDVIADSDFENFGLNLTRLITLIPPKNNIAVNWLGNSGSACAVYGHKITNNFPISENCKNIKDCDEDNFHIIPKTSDTYFDGFALGAHVSSGIEDTGRTFSIGNIKFEDMIIGDLGLKLYDQYNADGKEYFDFNFFSKSEIHLPKVDYSWIPSSWRDGKKIGSACISLGIFNITQEYTEWFSDKKKNLGKKFGLYAKVGEYYLFIPLDYLVDKDGNQVFFTTSLKIKRTNYQTRAKLRSIQKRAVIGEKINDSVNIAKNTKVVIFDLSSSNNSLKITMPDGSIVTQDSTDSTNLKIETKTNKYTTITLNNPQEGNYKISYIHTGDERFTVFGANKNPTAQISLDNHKVTFKLSDDDNDNLTYRLVLINDNNETVRTLDSKEDIKSGNFEYEIPNITDLDTGNYRVALLFDDYLSPTQKVVSANSIKLVKAIPNVKNIEIISTNDFTQINWDSLPNIEGYNIKLTPTNDDTSLIENNISANYYRISNLQDGNYTFSIYGYDDNLSGNSSKISFEVIHSDSKTIPEEVSDIDFTFDKDSIKLSWDKVNSATFYEVNIYKNGVRVVNELTKNDYIYLDNSYKAKKIRVEIISKNSANNSSEVFRKNIMLVDSIDSDSDNLPDMWEMVNFKSLKYNGDDDIDEDGLTNSKELSLGTNPTLIDSDKDKVNDKEDPYPLLNVDKNENYIPDDWEKFYNITNIMDDNDGDGYENYIEFFAGLNPNVANKAGIDVNSYRDRDFAPILVANIDKTIMVKRGEAVSIDLSNSFDINGDNLTYTWIVNTHLIDNKTPILKVDTSKTGMKRVEVTIKDENGNQTYRKFSIFVTDGDYTKVSGGESNFIKLNKFEVDIPKSAMKDDSYLYACDISHKNIPVDIMGREIVSDGLVYLYSQGSKLESPIKITPYIKDDEELDPYIFNYDTSVWTNLVTGETFKPIYLNRALSNSDKSYNLSTKETGILVFAKKPVDVNLTNMMSFDIENKTYAINLEKFKEENNLTSIDDVQVSDDNVIKSYLGLVSGKEEIRIDTINQGVGELKIVATKENGEKVSYTFITNVTNDRNIINRSLTLQKGWNLISLPVDVSINSKDIGLYFGFDVKMIWGYKDGKWSAYSPNNSIQKIIDKNNAIDKLAKLVANRGYWIYMDKKSNSEFSGTVLANIDYNDLSKGWHLLGSQEITDVKEMVDDNNISIVWKYSNNSWKAISNKENINKTIKEHYNLINSIKSNEGFWILKK